MQVSKVNPYYTPYRSNRYVKAISGFSIGEDGKFEFKETDDAIIKRFAEFIDYREFHRQWMSQGATLILKIGFVWLNNRKYKMLGPSWEAWQS